MSKQPKIIVIGAGAAGIAASAKLLEHGFTDLLILEAENRCGGRIHTIPFGESVVDLGAQWCHGETDNVVFEMVQNLDLLKTSKCTYTNHTFYDSTGNIVDKSITDLIFQIAANVAHDNERMKHSTQSFGSYFIERYIENIKHEFGSNKIGLDIGNSFVHWFHKLILCYDAPPNWFDISASGLIQYKECEGDLLLNWKDKGFQIFLDVLMQAHPNCNKSILEGKILLNKEVKKIVWDSLDVSVYCMDGSSFRADHVINTMSVGVLKEQHKNIFIPELPLYKTLAIGNRGFGTVDKILVKFPNKWWEEGTNSFCFLWQEDDRMNILNQFPFGPRKNGRSWLEDINGFYVIDSDSTTLLCWMVGEFTNDVESLDEKMLEQGCMFLLEKFLGKMYNIPKPLTTIRSKWFSNQHFRGSYSYISIAEKNRNTSFELSEPLIVGNKPVVLFGGESTHSHYYSTVHGAVETGYREANRIIEFNSENGVPGKRISLPSKY